jgi:hypothetical protein
MQWEGDLAEPVPRLGLWKPGQTPILCEPPQEESLAMKGYAGSVAATPDRILVTSPKGGVAMVFSADGAHVDTHNRSDICGAASDLKSFTVTVGLGAIWTVDDTGLTPVSQGKAQWDKHLVSLATGSD